MYLSTYVAIFTAYKFLKIDDRKKKYAKCYKYLMK